MAISFFQTAWNTNSSASSGGLVYKDLAITGVASGDLIVVVGLSADIVGSSTRSIVTQAGATTGAWTTSLPAGVSANDADVAGGYALATSSGTVTVRVSLRNSAVMHMGVGAWLIPAADIGATYGWATNFAGDADGQASVTLSGSSFVAYAAADWAATAIGSTPSTPAATNYRVRVVDSGAYSVYFADWSAQASGTRNYGPSGLSGDDFSGAIFRMDTAGGATNYDGTASLAGAGTITAAGVVGKSSGATLAGAGSISNAVDVGRIAYVKDLTPTNTKTSGTTNALVSIPAGGIAAGNTLVVGIATNNSSGGAPSVSSIEVPVGETAKWVALGAPTSPTTGSATGIRTSMWAIQTTMAWPGSTDYIITLSGSVSAKAVVGREFSGVGAVRRGSSTTASSTTGALSGSHSSANIAQGDMVIAVAGFESATAGSDDTDTLDGVWAAGSVSATSGSTDDTNVAVEIQHKFVTGASTQVYDTTGASTDATAIIATLIPAAQIAAINGVGTITASGSLGGGATNYDGTAALSGTAATTASGVVGDNAAATLSGSGAIVASGVVALASSATLTGTGTIVASGAVGLSSSASLAGTDSVAATGATGHNSTAALGGTASITASGSVALSSSPTLTGTGSITASGAVARSSAASLSGVGTITASGSVGRSSTASINGVGSITVSSGGATSTTSTLSGTGSITASGFVGRASVSSLTGTGTITASGSVGRVSTASLSGAGSITASGSVGRVSTASVAGAATITSAYILGLSSGAALTGFGTITTTSGQVPFLGTATLVGELVITAVGVVAPFGGWPEPDGRTLVMSSPSRKLELVTPTRTLGLSVPTYTLTWSTQ
jgi:hypothetical protein